MRFEFPDPLEFPGFLKEGEVWEDMPIPEKGMPIVNEMRRRIESARSSYNSISRRGMAVHSMTADVSELQHLFRDEIEKVKAFEPSTDIKSIDRSMSYSSEEVKHKIRRFFQRIGLWDVLMAYADVDVASVSLQYSTPEDRHHYQQLRDMETTTNLLNLHMDPKPGIVKSIIYLEIEDGPFQAIPESFEWEYDEEERIHAWGNSVGNYMHTTLHRQVVAALPKKIRKNAIVGRLIPDGSELSDFLLSKLVSYTNNVMLFDPCFTLHRGGLCKSGTRTNLQVVFR